METHPSLRSQAFSHALNCHSFFWEACETGRYEVISALNFQKESFQDYMTLSNPADHQTRLQ